jgi:hypothetical protein
VSEQPALTRELASAQLAEAIDALQEAQTALDGGDWSTGAVWSAMGALGAARAAEGRAERVLVDVLREAGKTWADIGDLLGVSRQAAWQRFGSGADG